MHVHGVCIHTCISRAGILFFLLLTSCIAEAAQASGHRKVFRHQCASVGMLKKPMQLGCSVRRGRTTRANSNQQFRSWYYRELRPFVQAVKRLLVDSAWSGRMARLLDQLPSRMSGRSHTMLAADRIRWRRADDDRSRAPFGNGQANRLRLLGARAVPVDGTLPDTYALVRNAIDDAVRHSPTGSAVDAFLERRTSIVVSRSRTAVPASIGRSSSRLRSVRPCAGQPGGMAWGGADRMETIELHILHRRVAAFVSPVDS